MVSPRSPLEPLLTIVFLQFLLLIIPTATADEFSLSQNATSTTAANNIRKPLVGTHLRARAYPSNHIITQKRELASGIFGSSDDVRREVVRGAEEKLRLSISETIATPDNTYFGGIRGVAYDADEKVYYVLSDDTLQYHRPPTETPSMAPSYNYTTLSPMPSSSPTGAPSGAPTGTPSQLYPSSGPLYTRVPTSSPTMSRETVEHKPRFYTVKFDKGRSIKVLNVTYLKNDNDQDYQGGDVLPLDIAYCEGRIFIAFDEAYTNRQYARPLLVEYNATGFLQHKFALPRFFRFNTPFTGISVSPNQQTLYAATNRGLNMDAENDIRITEFDLGTWQPGAQYVYQATNPVVGLESIDENGGFLVLERDQVPPPPTPAPTTSPDSDVSTESDPSSRAAVQNASLSTRTTVAPLPGTLWPDGGPRYDVHLYYALGLDALNVESVTSLKSQSYQAMRRTLVEAWTNTTLKLDAMGLSRDSKHYAKTKDGYDGDSSSSKDDEIKEEDPYERQRQRRLSDDSFEIILMTDNDFEGPTEVLFVELDVKETPLLIPTKQTQDINDSTGQGGTMAKDPAIWVHPTLPEYSLVLGALGTGGITVYDLLGNIRQAVNPGGDQTGVGVIYAFQMKPDNLEDVAVVVDRTNKRLRFYRVFHDISGGQYVTDITEYNSQPTLSSPRGVATYTSPFTAKHYAFVVSGDDSIVQIELESTDDNQRIMGTSVRTIPLDGVAGGIIVDQELGFLYISLDSGPKGIFKYDAEPDEDGNNAPQTVVSGSDKSLAAMDIAGMTLYYGEKGDGFLVVSVSGDSTFAVFEREKDNKYYDSFTIRNNQDKNVDRADTTQGIDIMNVNLGPDFKCGLFVVQDSDNAPTNVQGTDRGTLVNANSNFKLVPFEEMAEKLYHYLDVDTDSWGPRRFALVVWVNCIAHDIYAAFNDDLLSGRDTEALLDLLNDVTDHLYAPGTRKQQMISLGGEDPFGDYPKKRGHRRRRAMLEERRQESRRRMKEDQFHSTGTSTPGNRQQQQQQQQRRELKKKECQKRRLSFQGDGARDGLTEFLGALGNLRARGRLNKVDDARVQYWNDLATETRRHMPYAEY